MDLAHTPSFHKRVAWRDWNGLGSEQLSLTISADCITVNSKVVISDATGDYVARYSLSASADWSVRNVEARVDGLEQSLYMRRLGGNRWSDERNVEITELRGCEDLDLSITPLTNTSAIRGLRLEVGDSAETEVVYVEFPSLSVSRSRQRYTRLSRFRYLFESVGTTFARELLVDKKDLVVTYDGLFRRWMRPRGGPTRIQDLP